MQNAGKYTVCRLCLKSRECASTFEDVEAVAIITIETLGVLGLKLELDVNGRPVVCRTCSENLQKCFDFKTICLSTEEFITSFTNYRNDVKLDLQELYLRKNDNKDITLFKCDSICRLCMEIAKASCYIVLNDEAKDAMLAKTILETCFSELDLDVTKNPVICTSCNESLYSYFNFVKSCLVMENDIKKYCEVDESNNKSQEESKSALQFSAENILDYKSVCTDRTFDVPKNGDQNELHDVIKLELGNLAQKESQESYIKHEVREHEDVDAEKLCNIIETCYENKQNGVTESKCENLVETESSRCNIKREDIDLKPEDEDTARFQDGMLVFKDAPTVVIHQCNTCTFQTKHKNSLKRHLTRHEDISEVDMHQRREREYNTMYSCGICTYKAKLKYVLNRHMLIHKNASDVTVYTCGICPYKAKRKGNLKQHMLIHKNESEVTMYACETCTYKAKRKDVLQQHMLIHKNFSEVTMYSCGICTYKAKRNGDLKHHMLIHKNASEVTLYSCGICTYKSKQKGHVNQHMLNHKNASEVTMYSCEMCTYKTKQKGYLKRHMLIHKNASEVTMYSCGICTFKTKRKDVLNRHNILIHKNAAEVTMYYCGICTYETKQKSHLKLHMLIHKGVSEVTTYSCGICTYVTKLKGNLRQHILIHKNASEVTLYPCGTCTYKAKRNGDLKRHMLIHKNASEVTAS